MVNTTPILTEREKQILVFVSQGLTNKEIAQFLCIAVRTVEFHLGNIFRKLEVSSRITAVIAAARLGLIDNK